MVRDKYRIELYDFAMYAQSMELNSVLMQGLTGLVLSAAAYLLCRPLCTWETVLPREVWRHDRSRRVPPAWPATPRLVRYLSRTPRYRLRRPRIPTNSGSLSGRPFDKMQLFDGQLTVFSPSRRGTRRQNACVTGYTVCLASQRLVLHLFSLLTTQADSTGRPRAAATLTSHSRVQFPTDSQPLCTPGAHRFRPG